MYLFYSKLLNKVYFFVMIDFNRALVIHGFFKTLLCFLETLHKGACLLITTIKVCANISKSLSGGTSGSSTMVWFKVWRSNKKFSEQKHFISLNWLFLYIFLAFGFICFAIAKIGRWCDISYIGVPDNISCLLSLVYIWSMIVAEWSETLVGLLISYLLDKLISELT